MPVVPQIMPYTVLHTTLHILQYERCKQFLHAYAVDAVKTLDLSPPPLWTHIIEKKQKQNKILHQAIK